MRGTTLCPCFAGTAVLLAAMLFPSQTTLAGETLRDPAPISFHALPEQQLREGDIIFQTSLSPQSRAIQLATRSSWSHCGILYKRGGRFYVFEAAQTVKSSLWKHGSRTAGMDGT